MNGSVFVVFFTLVVFIASVKSKSFRDLVTSENENPASLAMGRSVDVSSDAEDLKSGEGAEYAGFRGVNSFDSSSQYVGEYEESEVHEGKDENEYLTNLQIDLVNGRSSQGPTSLKRMTTEQELLKYLSSVHQIGSNNYPENFQKEEPELSSPLMRRDISNWKGLHEFIEPDSIPWSFEPYDRHDGHSHQPASFERNNYPENFVEVKNESLLNGYQNPKDTELEPDLPQYIQKNYYNNFYLLVPNKKQAPEWGPDEYVNFETDKNRGHSNWHEEAYYYYDDNELYESGVTDQRFIQKSSARPPFQTHLLGPTLYIDNSGKISQSNLQGNSYQNIETASVGPNFTSERPNDSKPDSTASSASKNRRNNTSEQTTTDYSSAVPTELDDEDVNASSTTQPSSQNDVNVRLGPYGSEIMRRFGDFQTTDEPDNEDAYSSENYPHTTSYREEDVSGQMFGQSAGGMKKPDNESLIGIFTGNANATHPFPYWFTLADIQNTQSAPSSPRSIPWTPNKGPGAAYDDVMGGAQKKKEEEDCNDKMLPCPDTVNVTYPLNGYCNRYVTCESGKAIRRLCSNGLHFNPITKSCDLPHNSICTYACPEPNGTYGIPGDCEGYFLCKNSILEYRMCPPKMHWDVKREKCIFEEFSSCPMKCVNDNHIKSYEGDCKGYVICLQGIPYYHKCPPNMKFDQVSQNCIPEHLSECEDDPRLLVKTLNPNVLCSNILKKLGTKNWCNFFSENDDSRAPGSQ